MRWEINLTSTVKRELYNFFWTEVIFLNTIVFNETNKYSVIIQNKIHMEIKKKNFLFKYQQMQVLDSVISKKIFVHQNQIRFFAWAISQMKITQYYSNLLNETSLFLGMILFVVSLRYKIIFWT